MSAPSTKPTTVKDYWTRYFHPRPWPEFIDTAGFKAPDSSATWMERLHDNAVYYLANYLIVFVGLTLLIGLVFQQKAFVISFLLILGLAAGLFIVHSDPIVIPNANFKLEDLHKIGIWGLFSFFLLWLTEHVYTLVYCALFFGLVMLGHASMRQRSGALNRAVNNVKESAAYHAEKIGQDLDKKTE